MRKRLRTLYRTDAHGNVLYWKVKAIDNTIITEYGKLGGKKQTASKTCVGKNAGRSNETTPEYQALKEANAMWRAKLDYNYSLDRKEIRIRPMLAYLLQDFKDSIKYPVLVQPKLNGVRCLAYRSASGIVLLTRKGQKWNLPHIAAELDKMLPKDFDHILDGEIYTHGLTFQEVCRAIKGNPTSLGYHVYDCFSMDKEENYIQRDNTIRSLIGPNPYIHTVMSVPATYFQEIMDMHDELVFMGYEGGIVRDPMAPYKMGSRNRALLKVKAFKDAEFKIVGYYGGVGKAEGCVTWVCETSEGVRFDCCPKGSLSDRKYWFDNADKFIGKMLKVRYFDFTEAGKPYQPIGEGIRLKSD
jgi:DNA ligase-1